MQRESRKHLHNCTRGASWEKVESESGRGLSWRRTMSPVTLVFLLMCTTPTLVYTNLQNGPVPPDIRKAFCRNAVRGYTMVPWDCSGYIHCDPMSDLASWVECPHGLLFDMESITCKWYSSSCTTDAFRAVAREWCPIRPDLTFPHPDSCAMFFNCSKLLSEPQYDLGQFEDECSYYQLYDSNMGTCHPNPMTTSNICRSRPQGRCDFKRECKNTTKGPCTGQLDGFYSDQDNIFSPAFIKCSSGSVAGKYSCNQPQHVFDPEKRICTSNYTGSIRQFCEKNPTQKFPDPLQCAKFYDCARIHHALGLDDYQAECDYMYLFDSSTLACVRYDNLSKPCGSRFEPQAPCEYDVTDCSTKAFCLPCSATCKGFPDGDMPYPGLENTRFHLTCERGRTVAIKECKIPMVFRLDTRRCRLPLDLQPNIPLTTPAVTKPTTTTESRPTTKTTTTTTTVPTTTTGTTSTKSTTTTPVTSTTSTTTATPTSSPKTETSPRPSPITQQCACSEDLSLLNETMQNLTSDLSAVKTRMQNMYKRAYSCPDPPLLEGADVHLSYTQNEAKAKYVCHGSDVMCAGDAVITCTGGTGWNRSPGACLKTELVKNRGDDVSSIKICDFPLGSSIELWLIPATKSPRVLELHTRGGDKFVLNVTLDSTPGPVSLSHVAGGIPSPALYPAPRLFEEGMESHVALTLLTHHLLIEVDKKLLFKYPVVDIALHNVNLMMTDSGLQVRHVKIDRVMRDDVYTEFESTNLAIEKPVTASSFFGIPPTYSVDGNPETQNGRASCWHAQRGDSEPWLQVDLRKQFLIRELRLDIENKCTGCENVALMKPVTGVSIDGEPSTIRVVDGILSNSPGFCHTSSASAPSVVVDLGNVYNISSIALQRGESTMPDSLSDVVINVHEMMGGPATLCAMRTGALGEFETVVCVGGPVSGRYVSIERSPAVNKGPLTLCEVEVHTLVEDRLHDFSVFIYRDNPDLYPGAEGVVCTSQVGNLTTGPAGTLRCGEGVWGRYVRVKADGVLDNDDLMTVCEVEVYGDSVMKREWSPFDCRSPPLRANSAVSISYTENEAVATYSCNHGYSTCNGHHTLTCNSSGHWSGQAEMCLKTVFSTNEVNGLGTVALACSLKLGQAIELFIVPEKSSIVNFLNFLTSETILQMDLRLEEEANQFLLSSHSEQTMTPRARRVPDMTFTKGRESRVVVTFLSDHLDIAVDGKSVYAYPQYLLPDTINIVNSSTTFWKMSILPAGVVDTKLSHMTANLAMSRSATSSTKSGEAGKVVDGNTNTEIPDVSCWITAPGDLDPWWMVELDSFYFVSHVDVTSGNCAGACGGRLHDFSVEVSYKGLQKGGRWDVCREYKGIFPPGTTETLACREITYGRFVRISSPGRTDPADQLTLCEVKVFGGKVIREDSGPFDCGSPPRVDHAEVKVTTSSEGKMASYTCNDGYSLCGDISPSRCVDGIWGEFSALCFKNVWHYTSMGEMVSHNITCPVTLDSEIRVIATPTQNKRFSVELEFTPEKKIVFKASFTEPDINKASFYIKDGRRNITFRGQLPFPFQVEQEFDLTFRLLSKLVEVYVNGSKVGGLFADMISHHLPSLITSQLATRRVSVNFSNHPNKVVKHTDREQEWLRVPIQESTYRLFEVKAAENVYIDLRESETSKKGVTFIVGDRKNTRSVCANCVGGNMTSWHSPLSSWNFKKFWLSWDTPGKVSMGTGHSVGLKTFIKDAPADFEKNFLLVGTLGTDGHWVFPTVSESSSYSCPRPEPTFPLSIKSTQINDKKIKREYACEENYVFCGDSSVSVCDDGVASVHVMGGCELNRIPDGTGPVTTLNLPCEFGEGSVISAYITPTNDTGAVVLEMVGSAGKSLVYRIDMSKRNQTVTSQLRDGNQSLVENIVGFPFITNQESHVTVGYSSGIYKISVDGDLKHTYTPAVPHTQMSAVQILEDYSLKDLHLYPRNTPGDIPSCRKATLTNTEIQAGDSSLGGQTRYRCAPDYRDCSTSHNITCGGDGKWITSPDQICRRYIWRNLAMLRIPRTFSPPCPLEAGNAIKMVAQSVRGFWFDLRAGNEAQLLFQYEDSPTRLVLTTSILDTVLYEKSFNSSLISPNKEFTLLVQMLDTEYSVLIDGQLLYNYTYLTPVRRTKKIIITPGVTIKHLEIMA